MVKTILFIDYENISNFNLDNINANIIKIYIFVGNNQKKIPIELVIQIQKFGNNVKWIKITGQGKNALDFHIAFYLGLLNQKVQKDIHFIILTKDSGFDALISYLNNLGRKCKRIESLIELNGD